ncbi:Unhealthy ribosome biogenesis-like protein 2 [Oryzias melastigma]|uniref:Unhealthy ribosome biogenesis-like protein 2 n=1 Tax=Oryzias melastigma TaxID=30732 RepID=A0A834CEW6_ORYME|nr:Unhealthy ribosome biogenesis-like protein 2 [Oryzias melastigma]
MAAIYSGIHLKLRSPQTPWEDKLKLARFAWISSQCLLPNKEQVLLDWCIHALTVWHSKKVELSPDVLEGLWRYLDDVLRSRKLQTFLKQGKTVTLRLNFAHLLLDHLEVCPHGQAPVSMLTILSVCRGILSSPVLASVFTTKYELLVSLLSKLTTLACHEMLKSLPSNTKIACATPPPNQPESDSDLSSPELKKSFPSANLFEVLLQVLSCYLSVQRQQANPNRVFTVVTNQLVQPLVLLRYILNCQDSNLRRDIRLKIDSILQAALFPNEHLATYKGELLQSKEDSGKHGSGGPKGPLKPVSALLCKLNARGYCEPSLYFAVKSDALSLFFKFFLESYRKGKGDTDEEQRMLCFYFLTKLTPALDLHPDGNSSETEASPEASCSPESWSLALKAVESLLSQVLSADIYNVAADRIRHGEVQLNFYRGVAQLLYTQAKPSIPSWYRCLKVLLSLNHLILEPDLEQLLSLAWVNSENMEVQVQRARQLVVCSLLQTYTKLRQLPRLFSALLSVICQPALDERRPLLLPGDIIASLRGCLLETPPSQVVEICSSVLESIKTCMVKKKREELEKMEVEGAEEEREDSSLKLSSLSRLLHVILFSLKTLDNASPVPLLRKSQALMEEMQQIIKELEHLLSAETTSKPNAHSVQKVTKKGKKKELESTSVSKVESLWMQKAQEAALLLRYSWVEVDTLFHIYCSKYTSVNLPVTAPMSQAEAPSSSPLLAHMETLVSGSLLPSVHRPSCMSVLLLKLLTLQQMKKVLLDDTLISEPSAEALLKKAVQFVLSELQFEVKPAEEEEVVWDGQIGSVEDRTFPIAHWNLVASNLPLIAPYMSGDDAAHIAHILVTSTLRQMKGPKDLPSNCLTFSLISSQLLQSPVLAEMPSLFSAVVWFLTQRMIDILKAGTIPKVCPKVLTLHVKQSESVPSQKDVAQTVFTQEMTGALVEDVLASFQTGDVLVLLTEAQTKELMRLLRIFTNLNPDGMGAQDLSVAFLLLFFIFASTSQHPDQRSVDSPEAEGDADLLGHLLGMLGCLVEAKDFRGVLKLIHSGTLLQIAVSALLWHSDGVKPRASSSANWLDVVKAAQNFILSLVNLIIVRNNSVRLNLDQFASFLTAKEAAIRQVTQSSAGASVHVLLAILTSFSQAMITNLGRSKPMDQILTQVLTCVTASLAPAVELVLKPHSATTLNQAFLVEVVTVMLRCEMATLSGEDQLVLTHMTLYQSFCQQIIREMSSASRPTDFLVSSLRFLSSFYAAVEKTSRSMEQGEASDDAELDKLYTQILQAVHELLTAPWLSPAGVVDLEPTVQELLSHLVERSTTHQFNLLLLMIKDGLDICKLRAGNCREVLSGVITAKLLSCCQLPESCSRALWLIAPQIISAMVFLVRSSSQDVSLTLTFTVPTVTSLTSLLRCGEGFITNPHHVVLVLGALQSLPLDHLKPPAYHAVFLAVHEALFAILQCHPQVMLKAAPSFLSVFYRLVASIMQEGRQRGDADPGGDTDVYLECSILTERMYSHIAAAADSFTTLSAFMVAQYVTERQKVTLRSDVKLHLTEGIYCILDLCKEQDIRFLKAGLHTGVREVFNELYSSYTHYHKTQRQGEDKYTV